MIGLGEAEAADRLSGRHTGQPLGLLLLRPVAPDRVHGQRALDGRRAAQARIARLELTARHAVGDRPGARAAVTGQVHAKHAQLAEFRDDVTGQQARLEPVRDVRQRPVADEGAHGITD